jgi:hypothetical protein
MWEAVWGGCQPQPWHNHIMLTPQVKASPAHLILTVSLVKCLQWRSAVWQSVTWVYWWHMHIDGIMCSNSGMLGHTDSKLDKNRQKTQSYTHLKHRCHVWHAQRAGYGHFFQTFRISCGEWVEQVRLLRNGIGAIWKFDKSCTGPPTSKMAWLVWFLYRNVTSSLDYTNFLDCISMSLTCRRGPSLSTESGPPNLGGFCIFWASS